VGRKNRKQNEKTEQTSEGEGWRSIHYFLKRGVRENELEKRQSESMEGRKGRKKGCNETLHLRTKSTPLTRCGNDRGWGKGNRVGLICIKGKEVDTEH